MTSTSDHRHRQDRRRQSRGGRRLTDADGFAPLVMVVGSDPTVVTLAEAVLARLRFAVTTSPSVEDATRVLPGLKPDIIVAAPEDTSRLRMEAPEHLSVVELTGAMRDDPRILIEAIRESLRANW
jgi:hypothetical protein